MEKIIGGIGVSCLLIGIGGIAGAVEGQGNLIVSALIFGVGVAYGLVYTRNNYKSF